MNSSIENPIKIIFCIPGRQFTNHFLTSWTNLLSYCFRNNIQAILCNRYTSNVYYVRSMCLGGNVLSGVDQKPWQGKIDYDYMMWIDSDIVFQPEQIMQLLNHKKDIVTGMYKMNGGTHYAIVKDWNEEQFLKNGTFSPDTLLTGIIGTL